MPITPANFDGAKFAAKFKTEDFHIVENMLICPSLPNLTEADLADCVVDMVAYEQRKADESNTRATIKEEYQSTIATLEQIENAQSPTNAQVITAVKFLAKTLHILMRLLVRRYT